MIFAAKHLKDRTRKLFEDEITSCVFGPLSFMTPEEVRALFLSWLPFSKELWSTKSPTGIDIKFWPNLAKKGRVEPDILVQFKKGHDILLTIMFEIKWESPLSGRKELVNQWNALPNEEKEKAFHVYLVKKTERGHQELIKSLEIYSNKVWEKRLVCIGWRTLIETLHYSRPKFGSKMNLWADAVSSFLERKGQTIFTGFENLSKENISISKNDLFWKRIPWLSKIEPVTETLKKDIFWQSKL